MNVTRLHGCSPPGSPPDHFGALVLHMRLGRLCSVVPHALAAVFCVGVPTLAKHVTSRGFSAAVTSVKRGMPYLRGTLTLTGPVFAQDSLHLSPRLDGSDINVLSRLIGQRRA